MRQYSKSTTETFYKADLDKFYAGVMHGEVSIIIDKTVSGEYDNLFSIVPLKHLLDSSEHYDHFPNTDMYRLESLQDKIETLAGCGEVYEFDSCREMMEWCIKKF